MPLGLAQRVIVDAKNVDAGGPMQIDQDAESLALARQ
jgi:hypothetical protein